MYHAMRRGGGLDADGTQHAMLRRQTKLLAISSAFSGRRRLGPGSEKHYVTDAGCGSMRVFLGSVRSLGVGIRFLWSGADLVFGMRLGGIWNLGWVRVL